jgi:hypothetical protein
MLPSYEQRIKFSTQHSLLLGGGGGGGYSMKRKTRQMVTIESRNLSKLGIYARCGAGTGTGT